MTTYPTITLDTKHGKFTVTVWDPSPRKGQRDYEVNELFRIDGEAVINRVPVRLHAGFKKYPKRDKDTGNPIPGEFWAQPQSYGIQRTDSHSHDVPDGVRRIVNAYGEQALALITPDLVQAARKARLTDEAARLRNEIDSKFAEINRLETEAAALEAEAATL